MSFPSPIAAQYFVNLVCGVGAESVLRVYDYDRTTKVFTPTSFAEGRTRIEQTDDEFAFVVDGQYVFFANDDGEVSTGSFTDRLAPLNFPRLEFFRQVDPIPDLVAAISKDGIFYSFDVNEADTLPDGDDQIIWYDKISLGLQGLTAVAVKEMCLLRDETGRYILAAGKLIAVNI